MLSSSSASPEADLVTSAPQPGDGEANAYPPKLRLPALDALRALAMLWMAGFHLCFDLNMLGLWSPRQHLTLDPFWSWQRVGIVSTFLFCAGMGQALAACNRQSARAFWRRWLQVLACAALVSVSSWWMFPRSWIYFGVLHGIAALLLMLRGLSVFWVDRLMSARPHPRALVWTAIACCLLAAFAIALPASFRHAAFDAPWLHWTGLVTRLPVTEDFVPVLPWAGPMLLGYAAGLVVCAWRVGASASPSAGASADAAGGAAAGALPGSFEAGLAGELAGQEAGLVPVAALEQLQPEFSSSQPSPSGLGKAAANSLSELARLGQWPLSFYMLHQPVWLGLLHAGLWLGLLKPSL